MKTILLIGLTTFSIAYSAIAESNKCPELLASPSTHLNSHVLYMYALDQDDPSVRWNNAIGTFQIQVLNGRRLPEIDITIIDEIESLRHNSEVMYLDYNERIRIKILPHSIINADFEKLELMVYVDSFNSNN